MPEGDNVTPASAAPLPVEPLRAGSTYFDLDTPFTRWLVRWRWIFFCILIVILLLPFNGQWRLGLDSSIYRGVAENLVDGKGYTFAGLPQKQVYPGLPFLLAALHKVTGSNSVVPVLVFMNLCALLAAGAMYLLVKLRYPTWIAVVVTCGVAMNLKFAQQAQEVMTDMPFLLGCLLAMLGWEWLAPDQPRSRRWGAIGLLLIGLFLAAVMRPTFWVLALAMVLTCLWNIVRRLERRSLITLGVLVVVGVAFAAIDPRVTGLNFLKGGYERELLSLASDFRARIALNAPKLFGKEITETFFNEPLWHFAIPLAILLLAGSAMVMRRQPLWGMQVFILTGVMLVLSDVPRYYVMVLPTMWLGYVLMLLWLNQKLPPMFRDWSLFVLFSLANFLNLSGVVLLTREQHRQDFLKHYRDGTYVRLLDMAKVVENRVPENGVVVGPYAYLLTYLSHRNVLSGRLMGFDVAKVTRYPTLVAACNPTYLIGPATDYMEKDPAVGRLIERGVLKPFKFIDKVNSAEGTLWLTEMQVVVPETDWRKLPTTRPIVIADRPVRTRPAFTPEELARREAKARKLRKELKAKRERKARRARKLQQQQTTQPTTAPVTAPAAQSALQIPLESLGLMWWAE